MYLKIVNTKRNEKFLEKLPHINFLDLSIISYISFNGYDDETAIVNVTVPILENWKKNINEVIEIAKVNMVKAKDFKSISNVINQMLEIDFFEYPEVIPLFVLTNMKKSYGGSYIYITEVLKEIAENFHHDLYILPSSLHELIIVPILEFNDENSIQELKDMVCEVNNMEVPYEDILSYNVYKYNRIDNIVSIM